MALDYAMSLQDKMTNATQNSFTITLSPKEKLTILYKRSKHAVVILNHLTETLIGIHPTESVYQ